MDDLGEQGHCEFAAPGRPSSRAPADTCCHQTAFGSRDSTCACLVSRTGQTPSRCVSEVTRARHGQASRREKALGGPAERRALPRHGRGLWVQAAWPAPPGRGAGAERGTPLGVAGQEKRACAGSRARTLLGLRENKQMGFLEFFEDIRRISG